MSNNCVHVIGGGLAGVEASWQCLQRNIPVILHEMRPLKTTPAHKTSYLAELVCSNSFKSQDTFTASGQLKYEMSLLNSLVIQAANIYKIPADKALAVDRKQFSQYIHSILSKHPLLKLVIEEVTHIPDEHYLKEHNQVWIIATGPLSSKPIIHELYKLCDNPKNLYFYDAISPIVDIETVNLNLCFQQNRYQKNFDEIGDYINIPLNKVEYENFVQLILQAPKVSLHNFEEQKYFESCLPIEVLAQRGLNTLRFGPMKPIGLIDPKTNKRPWAVIQMRAENINRTMYNLVGFQTKMTHQAQLKVFRSIHALKDASFLRLGSIHKNTYFNSPQILNNNLSFKKNSRLLLAGQITGVEGYLESAAIGIIAGIIASGIIINKAIHLPPKDTIIGALLTYITQNKSHNFIPMNANLGILPESSINDKKTKVDKKIYKLQQAQKQIKHYLKNL